MRGGAVRKTENAAGGYAVAHAVVPAALRGAQFCVVAAPALALDGVGLGPLGAVRVLAVVRHDAAPLLAPAASAAQESTPGRPRGTWRSPPECESVALSRVGAAHRPERIGLWFSETRGPVLIS